MRRTIIVFTSLAFLAPLSSTAFSADNFDFFVMAVEPSLKLVIAGYATDGTQIFKQQAGQLSKSIDGAMGYDVQVPRSEFQGRTLAEFCVQDLTGKSKLSLKSHPEVVLCDNRLEKNKSIYYFSSLHMEIADPTGNKVGRNISKDSSNSLTTGLTFTIKAKPGDQFKVNADPPECFDHKKMIPISCEQSGSLEPQFIGEVTIDQTGIAIINLPVPGFGIVCAYQQVDKYPTKCAAPGKSVKF